MTKAKGANHSAIPIRRSGNLPDDLGLLVRYYAMTDDLLAFLANRIEPTWDLAEKALAETAELQELQQAIAAKIAARPAGEPADVLCKLSVWKLSRDLGEPASELSVDDRLILSVIADLEAIFAPLRPRRCNKGTG